MEERKKENMKKKKFKDKKRFYWRVVFEETKQK